MTRSLAALPAVVLLLAPALGAQQPRLVADLRPGRFGSGLRELAAHAGRLYFSPALVGGELWTSDATAKGTKLVADLRPGPEASDPKSLASAAGALWFTADDGVHGHELWRSDGTAAGTKLVANLVVLCGRCHGLVHASMLEVRGEGGGKLRFFDARGEERGGARAPRARCVEPIVERIAKHIGSRGDAPGQGDARCAQGRGG